VNILEPLDCATPTGITVFDLSGTGFSVSWDDQGAVSYNWEVRTGGLPGTGGEFESGSTSGLSFSTTDPLSPNTNYYVYVQADCGPDGLSYWGGPLQIYTGYCAAGADNAVASNNPTVNLVEFANISQTTPNGLAGYVDHTSTVGNVDQGETYTMTLSRLNAYTFDQFLVWVDWNDDLDRKSVV